MRVYSFTSWPGISKVDDEFLRLLYEEATARGWDPDSLAGHISHESGFDSAAKNPKGTASGLIQITAQTAKMLNTSVEFIRRMSAKEQLPLVFKFFDKVSGGSKKLAGSDFLKLGFGHGAIKAEYGQNIASKGQPAYDLNASLDVNQDGNITPEDMDEAWLQYKDAASKKPRTITLRGDVVGFTRAQVTSSGDVVLKPNVPYFIDTSVDNYSDVYSDLRDLLGKDSEIETLTSGRGHIISVWGSGTGGKIPNEVASKTGYWYEAPVEKSTVDISRELYGEIYDNPEEFWEWLSTNHPDTFNVLMGIGKAFEGAANTVKDIGINTGKIALSIVFGLVGVGILYAVIQRKKRGST